MQFLVTFEAIDSALFASAAETLYAQGFEVGDVFGDGDSSGWAEAGDAGAVVSAPARRGAPELIAGRIAQTISLYGVKSQVTYLR